MKRRTFLTTAAAAAAATVAPSCQRGATGPALNVYTWADYLNPEIAKRFEQENGCKLVLDTFDSNEAMYAKLRGGATGYDVLIPSSYMVKTLQRERMLRPLDQSKLPNLSHVDPDYLKSALDPQMDHSVPYMMAPTCLGWLGSKVPAAKASYAMFDRADLKGRITLLDDMREVLGAGLKSLGHRLNSTDPAQLTAAANVAIRWKANIAKFENEQYKTGLASGEFLLVQGYAGDLLQVTEENGDIVVAIPEEGTGFSCDDLCIPASSTMVELAHTFINFVTDPEVAAKNMEWIAYRAPNKTAYSHLSEDFRGTAALFPAPDVFAKCEPIDDLGDKLPLWTEQWDRVKSA